MFGSLEARHVPNKAVQGASTAGWGPSEGAGCTGPARVRGFQLMPWVSKHTWHTPISHRAIMAHAEHPRPPACHPASTAARPRVDTHLSGHENNGQLEGRLLLCYRSARRGRHLVQLPGQVRPLHALQLRLQSRPAGSSPPQIHLCLHPARALLTSSSSLRVSTRLRRHRSGFCCFCL